MKFLKQEDIIFSMNNIDEINNKLKINEIVKQTIEIKYKPATLFHRVMANLLDIIIVFLVVVALYLGIRQISINTSTYQNAYNNYRKAQIDSSLYFDDKSNSYPSIISYLDEGSGISQIQKHRYSKNSVISFYEFIIQDESVTEDIKQKIDQTYITYFTDESLSFNGYKYIESFEIINNQIQITECDYSSALVDQEVPHDVEYYVNVYKPFINNTLLTIFGNYSSLYKDNIAIVAKIFILIDLPNAYALGGLLVYLIPALFFKRGHKTLGKALYHIGLIDSRYLNVTWKRFFVRFLIFYFGIYLLSILTIGVPFIISTSMMLFTKKKQGFADYMLDLREIDTSTNKIYYSLEEINLSNIKPNHEPVDFKPEREL